MGNLSARRSLIGFVLALAGLLLLTVLLSAQRDRISLPGDMMLYLVAVVAVALVGGLWPALVSALVSSLLLTYFFIPPLYALAIEGPQNALALLIFLLVAAAMSLVVDRAAERTRRAASASADAARLAGVAGSVLRGARPLPALLAKAREAFGLSSATLLERAPEASWQVVGHVGDPFGPMPSDGETVLPVPGGLRLVLRGRPFDANERRVADAFAAQAAVAFRQQRRAEEAALARQLAEADQMRTALLAAVSHDLRTPLGVAKASINGLRGTDVAFSAGDRAELLAIADEALDRLGRLIANLLDLSRLRAGALVVSPGLVGLEEAVPRALDELGPASRRVAVQVPADLPPVRADPGLLERVLVNVIGNALRDSRDSRHPSVVASEHAGLVALRVIDHGPGVEVLDRDRMFQPFQRVGDHDGHPGLGLGLALSRGLAEAMGGNLIPETTPGGGLTMVLTLPADGRVGVDAL